MKISLTEKNKEYAFLILLLCCSSFFLHANLGNQYLWQDEAETALLSRTILEHGVPLGYDGKNYFSQYPEKDRGKNYIWRYHPWFPFYLLSAFFYIFGINTFFARLPFALFGIATIILTYYFTKTLFKDKRVAGVAAFLLTVSVPFLILSRQCRYYSPTMFFSVLGLYSFINVLEGKKKASVVFVISSTLLFHCNYVSYAALISTFFFYTLLLHRNNLRAVLLLLAIIILVNFPWIIWFAGSQFNTNEIDNTSVFNFAKFLKLNRVYISHVMKYLFHPFLLLCPIFIVGYRWKKSEPIFSKDIFAWKSLLLLVLFIFINLQILSIVAPLPFFRYLAPVIPVVYIIIAVIVVSMVNVHVVFGIGIIVILIYMGTLHKFIYEITHDYDGPIEGIVKFLKQNGNKDDLVAITYGDLPVKFYTNMRVIGGLTGEDLSPAKEADWIIVRRYLICHKDRAVRKYLIENIPWKNYQGIIIDYPDIPFENRESPQFHRYKTEMKEQKVFICRRIR
ncbi:MAG: phospholipid carrier-dependent glycosyltransferase [Desulfobacteraceae bacterium]|nr:glycosyltransferase family 39 protein [Desulfobacteraceae bacterium]MBC2757484.1 phospholipid carrier-dependent glycosyltransferase [Desulfobacteraceae bacterium]